MDEIDAARLVLRRIAHDVAEAILDGREPAGVTFAPGYPSRFSLETMALVAPAGEATGFGPYFMVRKDDDAVVGEIGCRVHAASGTGQVGYTVVEPCWNQGYATEALRALLDRVRGEPGVRRVVANTLAGHTASRRVLEKAGMRLCEERLGEVDGETVDLVVYELDPAS